MSDPMHARVCLTGLDCDCPSVSIFVVPEPLISGGQMLHMIEQAPVGEQDPEPEYDDDLIELLQAMTLPLSTPHLADASVVAFRGTRHDPTAARAVLRDHLIRDPEPWGLDIDDPAELTRLAMLPERRIAPRRIDDFQSHSIRESMDAVYRFFGIDQRVPLVYHGYADPSEGWFALRASSVR
ncbi:hypothetical protein [Nocardia camponoti]|uniref:Uncharacterized protein n=1 Tax=Nocardia camponoti TaxID=1616106 RepID=A0A917QKW8_9NOCA|nr:hypothetical protein [Nocardia camponoti]GGK55630.1 hypothetical protein GCM10011591_29550 [Nocardia camponoti]